MTEEFTINPYKRVPRRASPRKKQMTAKEIADNYDVCPFRSMIRCAIKLEQQKKWSPAGNLWEKYASYIQPKYKAVDPLEQAERASKVLNLGDLQELKQAILSGEYSEIESALKTPVPEAVEVQSLL